MKNPGGNYAFVVADVALQYTTAYQMAHTHTKKNTHSNKAGRLVASSSVIVSSTLFLTVLSIYTRRSKTTRWLMSMHESRSVTSLSRIRNRTPTSRLVQRKQIWEHVHWNLLRHRLLPLYVFLVLSAASVLSQNDGFSDKEAPEKGDVKCPSLADRYNNFNDGGDATTWLSPCEEGTSLDDQSKEIPSNGIVLQLFAALPAFAGNFQTIMSWAVVGYLDEISLEYSVKSNFSIPIDLLNHTERRINPIYDADVIFQFVISEQIQTLDASWWYQYQFVFHCFYGNADTQKVGQRIVEDAGMLRVVKQNLNQYLREGVELVNLFDLRELSYGVLGLAVEDPRYAAVPFQDGPPTQPPTLVPTYAPISIDFDSNGTVKPTFAAENQTAIVGDKFDGPLPDSTYTMYTLPVDVNTWDWRRYLGLCIFICTMIGTILLTHLAAYRRRQINAKDIWGNLGTEQGVDALLSTGWKLKGSKMEVYNKEGIGYRDDDSMLLGGCEQTAYLGAEITVTQDSKSATTPD